MQTKKQRLDYLRKIKGLKYADLIGDESIVTPDNLRVTVSRENEKIDYYLSLIAKKHNISERWLINGVGEMENMSIENPKPIENDFFSHLSFPEPHITEKETYQKLEELKKKKNPNPEPSSRVINDDDLVDAIEYVVPWKGQAGMASKFYATELIDQLKKTVVKVKPEHRGVFYRIEVDGNSMPPKIQPGDWLRCEEISSLFWLEKNFFKTDKIYCIWHNSRGIIFKRLIYKEMGEIWCSSDNEDKNDFPDFPLEIEKVNKILIVRKLVDRNF